MAFGKKNDGIKKNADPGALARPDFMEAGDVRGSENIQQEDLRFPRLSLAQALSPEVDPTSAKYVEGLTVGDAFNSLTGQVYGKAATYGANPSPAEPVEIAVVRAELPRYVEFVPRDEGGGVKDLNVRPGDPRCAWGPKGEKPVATKFLEFVVLLLGEDREPAMLSFKGSGLNTGKNLNSLVKLQSAKLGNVPSFGFRFALTPAMTENTKGKFAIFQVRPTGLVDKPTFKLASDFYDSIKDRAVAPVLNDEPDDADEKAPF